MSTVINLKNVNAEYESGNHIFKSNGVIKCYSKR